MADENPIRKIYKTNMQKLKCITKGREKKRKKAVGGLTTVGTITSSLT